MPPIKHFGSYICEACVVRAQLGRELVISGHDVVLLMLERMRQIDQVNTLAPSTHQQYQYKLDRVHRFGETYGLPMLQPTPLASPPVSEAIGLEWVQEHYALQPSTRRNKPEDRRATVAGITVRGIRSAASLHHRLDLQIAYPGQAYLDANNRVLVSPLCSPTDELSSTMFASGLLKRLGEESVPAVPLLARHVEYMDKHFEVLYQHATNPSIQREICRAAAANSSYWLSWLRANELFNMDWKDLDITLPDDGPSKDLPPSVGVLEYRLLPETKSNRTRTADVITAFTSCSGISPGLWLTRLRTLCNLSPEAANHSSEPIFHHPNGDRWDSRYFRQTYLWPLLQEQRLAGDPYLAQFDGSPGNSIPEKFYSLHCYRRGARTHVSKRRERCHRKATPDEVKEHGRWKQSRRHMDMPTAYLQWPLIDRIALTLFCM